MEENTQLQIKVMWIPGHAKIEGNERADEEAKKAAKNPNTGLPFKHKPLKSARGRQKQINNGGVHGTIIHAQHMLFGDL